MTKDRIWISPKSGTEAEAMVAGERGYIAWWNAHGYTVEARAVSATEQLDKHRRSGWQVELELISKTERPRPKPASLR